MFCCTSTWKKLELFTSICFHYTNFSILFLPKQTYIFVHCHCIASSSHISISHDIIVVLSVSSKKAHHKSLSSQASKQSSISDPLLPFLSLPPIFQCSYSWISKTFFLKQLKKGSPSKEKSVLQVNFEGKNVSFQEIHTFSILYEKELITSSLQKKSNFSHTFFHVKRERES